MIKTFLIGLALLFSNAAPVFSTQVTFGSEILVAERLNEIRGKRIGLVVNQVSTIGNRHLADTLLSSGISVTSFFAPEHGVRGQAAAGETVKDGVDLKTGIPIVSLYGKKKMPDSTDMSRVDVILFDLQDVGARPFTYSSTMAYLMEACAKFGKTFVVLDRPNPLGGNYVSGWVLEDSLRSFVGRFPLPMAHGLTMGELALMIEGERWVSGLDSLSLKIIPVSGLKRSMRWMETGRKWVGPSPNLADLDAVLVYPGTVLFEGTTFSEGRGTEKPFVTIGSPDLKMDSKWLNKWAKKAQIQIDVIKTTPKEIPGRAIRPKFQDKEIVAVRLLVDNENAPSDPVAFGADLLRHLLLKNPAEKTNSFLWKLAGSRRFEKALGEKEPIENSWKDQVSRYIAQRKPYLMYE